MDLTRTIPALALLLALFWPALPAARALPPAKPELYSARVDVPQDFDAQQLVLRARDFAKRGAFDRACALLQELISSERSAESVFSEDGRVFVPLRDRCHRILSELPAAGIRMYRSAVDPAARRLLEEARTERDQVKLVRVTDLYLCSSAGDEALDRLAAILLDRGDLAGARSAWKKLLEICPGDDSPDRDHVRLKLAAVESLLGRATPAAKTLRAIRKGSGGRSVRLGGTAVRLDEVTSRSLPGALRKSDDPAPRAVRLGRLRLVWRRDFRAVRPDPSRAMAFRPYAGQGRFLALPAAEARYVDGRLYAKDYNRLWVFDPRSPRRTFWSTSVQNLGRPVAESSGRVSDMPHFNAAWIDRGAQCVSVAEGVVLVTERNGYRQHARGSAVQEDFPNHLTAYAVRTGKRLWSTVDLGPPVEGAHFLTTPTVRDGIAYVPLTGKDGMFHVAAYRVRDGSLSWIRKVGRTSLRGVLRASRNDASRLVVDADSVYALTNSGLVARLDLLEGRTRWIARTPKTHQDSPNRTQSPAREFAPSDPVLAKGVLVLAPSDSIYVVAIDASTGKEIWKQAVEPSTTHLVGVVGDRVILGGVRMLCYELRPRQNRPRLLWKRDIEAPSGRACILGESIYVASGKTIRRFSAIGPSTKGSSVVRTNEPVGNLSPLPNGLVSSNAKGIRVFADVHAQFSVLTKRLRATPEDLALRLDRARLCAAAGGEREDMAVQDLEVLLGRLDEDDRRVPSDLRDEIRGLLLEILLRRTRAGSEGAAARAGEIARTLGERIRVAVARADACATSGDALGAVRALHAVLPEARECVVGSGETTRDAEAAIRGRLLPLRRHPEIRAWADEQAAEGGVSGTDLADRYPTATGSPGVLLSAAQQALGVDPALAHDLAVRLSREYPDSDEATAARDLVESTLRERGLEPAVPGTASSSFPKFPLRHLVEIGAENAVAPAVTGSHARVATSTMLLVVPGNDGRVLEGRSAAMGSLRWRVGFPRASSATPQSVASYPHLVRIEKDRLTLATPVAIHWFSRGSGGGVGGRIATQALPAQVALDSPKSRRNVRVIAQGGSPYPLATTLGTSYAPGLLITHGLTIGVGRGRETAYRLGPRVEGERRVDLVWSRSVHGERIGRPLVVEDRLVVTRSSPSRVTVCRLDTGKVTASIDLGAESPAGPAVAGPDGDLYVATASGEVSRHDLLTGRWEWSTRLGTRVVGILHVDRTRVVALGADGRATVLATRDGTPEWTSRIVPAGSAAVDSIVADGRLIVWSGVAGPQIPRSRAGFPGLVKLFSSMSVAAVDLATGEESWPVRRLQGGARFPGGTLRLGKRLLLPAYMIGRDTRVEVLRMEDGKFEEPLVVPLARRGRTSQVWQPELSRQGDHLLLRTPQGIFVFGRGTKAGGVRTD